MSEETKKCKHCQSDIPKKAKVCPNCRKKQSNKLGIILIIVGVIIIIGVLGGTSSDDSTNNTITKETTTTSANTDKKEPVEEKIEYVAISVDDLDTILQENALKASETYKGKYLEITGRLSNIDASGKYISLSNDELFDLHGVQCYIKNDEQKSFVMDMEVDKHYTVKVKIKDVGEVIGYTADIIEFVD